MTIAVPTVRPVHGNFDIVVDGCLRISQLYMIPAPTRAVCDALLYLASAYWVLIGADWC